MFPDVDIEEISYLERCLQLFIDLESLLTTRYVHMIVFLLTAFWFTLSVNVSLQLRTHGIIDAQSIPFVVSNVYNQT